jgi:hypothetical protein
VEKDLLKKELEKVREESWAMETEQDKIGGESLIGLT